LSISLFCEENKNLLSAGINRINNDLKDLSKLLVRCGEWDVISTDEKR
jgi:hypothetical protein